MSVKKGVFSIDFFELMWLAESVIPPMPIARSVCFDDFSERHYHNMSAEERVQFFEHVKGCARFDLENRQCRHFFARFNPENQYKAYCFHNGKPGIVDCYFFEEEYRTAMNRRINRGYIKKVVKVVS